MGFRKKKKWLFFNKILFLRNKGVYNGYSLTSLKKKKIKKKKFIPGIDESFIDYFNNFFNIMKNLRYLFLYTFLKKSKNLKKIRKFIISKNITTHPHVFKNFCHVETACFGIMPAPIVNTSISFVNKWLTIAKQISSNNKLNHTGVFNSFEYDCSAGTFKKLWNIKNSQKLLFWPIFIKVLYWRLYAT